MKKSLLFSLLLSMSALADTWNGSNDPANFDSNYEYHLSRLPLKAELPNAKAPWSSSYWPRMKGSINYRWNTENPTGFNLKSPNREQVMQMSREDLARLSPAEKFDLARGRYDYPLSSDVAAGATPNAKDYEGICDGWTASSIQFSEPLPVDHTNPDGIVIPFGSSDVKALMSYDISINFEPGAMQSRFVGKYCVVRLFQAGPCADINPGAFHVVLANQIALKQQSFAVDIEYGRETWNQPVVGFEFEIRGSTRVSGAAQAYIVHAKLKYAEDDPEAPEYHKVFNWNPVVGTENYMTAVQELDYILELDYAGRIIGGEWIGSSRKQHPDLFWMPTKKIEWTPDFKLLYDLYKPAHQ